jgi:hypothetical protein
MIRAVDNYLNSEISHGFKTLQAFFAVHELCLEFGWNMNNFGECEKKGACSPSLHSLCTSRLLRCYPQAVNG